MRIYNKWAGNPRGTKEDITRCIVSVADGGRSVLSHQCYRKRGKGYNGLFCGIHAKRFGKENLKKSIYIPEDNQT
jgi:hypothetical protein